MGIKNVLVGTATFLPGASLLRTKVTKGSNSARYCYSVWLRHLVMAYKNGLCTTTPKQVAELGPGDSIGAGLAALISGAEAYYGLDVIEFTSPARNVSVFEELLRLFRAKESIPGEEEFPRVKPTLDSYEFPDDVLTDSELSRCLAADRIAQIRRAIEISHSGASMITYAAPFCDAKVLKPGSMDMVFSQAVLQYVEKLPVIYQAMYSWLRRGGFISHQIGFGSDGLAEQWNGYWKYSDWAWKLVKGRREYGLNREPFSAHLRCLTEAGFRLAYEKKVTMPSNLARHQLAPRFRNLSAQDITTNALFFQAVKAQN
jgi:hypothetical protein